MKQSPYSNATIFFSGLITGVFILVLIHLAPRVIQEKFWLGGANGFLVGSGIVVVSTVLNYFAGSLDRVVRILGRNK